MSLTSTQKSLFTAIDSTLDNLLANGTGGDIVSPVSEALEGYNQLSSDQKSAVRNILRLLMYSLLFEGTVNHLRDADDN